VAALTSNGLRELTLLASIPRGCRGHEKNHCSLLRRLFKKYFGVDLKKHRTLLKLFLKSYFS